MPDPEVFVPKPSKTQSRIHYDLEAGIMTEKSTGKRVIWLAEDFAQAMHVVASRMLRAGAPAMLERMGFFCGESMFREAEKHLLASRPSLKRIHDLSVQEFVGYVDEIWSQNGLGRFEMSQSFERIFVNLYFSVFSKVLEKTGKPYDHIYAGMYSGLFSALLGQKVACVEIMCVSQGYDYCRFLLGKEESIEPVRDWVDSGVPYEEIIEKLQGMAPGAGLRSTAG